MQAPGSKFNVPASGDGRLKVEITLEEGVVVESLRGVDADAPTRSLLTIKENGCGIASSEASSLVDFGHARPHKDGSELPLYGKCNEQACCAPKPANLVYQLPSGFTQTRLNTTSCLPTVPLLDTATNTMQ